MTEAELLKNCIQLGRFSNGAYNIQWMESVSLDELYSVIDQVFKIVGEEQSG
jgi:predicted transport protein